MSGSNMVLCLSAKQTHHLFSRCGPRKMLTKSKPLPNILLICYVLFFCVSTGSVELKIKIICVYLLCNQSYYKMGIERLLHFTLINYDKICNLLILTHVIILTILFVSSEIYAYITPCPLKRYIYCLIICFKYLIDCNYLIPYCTTHVSDTSLSVNGKSANKIICRHCFRLCTNTNNITECVLFLLVKKQINLICVISKNNKFKTLYNYLLLLKSLQNG